MFVRLEQPENMELVFVKLGKIQFPRSAFSKLEQSENIFCMVASLVNVAPPLGTLKVTFLRFVKPEKRPEKLLIILLLPSPIPSMVSRLEQPENMSDISVTFEMLKFFPKFSVFRL